MNFKNKHIYILKKSGFNISKVTYLYLKKINLPDGNKLPRLLQYIIMFIPSKNHYIVFCNL